MAVGLVFLAGPHYREHDVREFPCDLDNRVLRSHPFPVRQVGAAQPVIPDNAYPCGLYHHPSDILVPAEYYPAVGDFVAAAVARGNEA